MKSSKISRFTFVVLAAVVLLVTTSPAQDQVATVFAFGHGTGSVGGGASRYLAAFDGASATANNFRIVIPRDGTLKNLFWAAIASTLTGSGSTITVLRNGNATSLVATWNSNTISGNNTVNSEAVNAGDVISVRIEPASGPGNITRPTVSFELVTPSSSGSQWISTGNDIYYTAGNVGIATTNPTDKLHISGDGLMRVNVEATNGDARFRAKTVLASNYAVLDLVNDMNETGQIYVGGSNTNQRNLQILTSANMPILFGAGGASAANSQMALTSSGNVGIGTVNPTAKLDVQGDISFQNSKLYFAGAVNPTYYMQYITSSGLQFKVNNYEGLFLDVNGNAGIGTTTPGTYRLYVAGTAYSTGGWSSSDLRFKENIAAIKSPLQKVMRMRGVSYAWRNKEYANKGFPDGKHFGVIAQEIEQVVPEVVREGPEGEKAVAYAELIPILIEAIKEQQRVISGLVDNLRQHGIEIDITGESSEKIDKAGGSATMEIRSKKVLNDVIPTEYSLSFNYPNPFNPMTTVNYALPRAGLVTIIIYDALGREVRTLIDEQKTAGKHTVQWDGKNQRGESVASGTYLYRMQAGDFVQTREMSFVK